MKNSMGLMMMMGLSYIGDYNLSYTNYYSPNDFSGIANKKRRYNRKLKKMIK